MDHVLLIGAEQVQSAANRMMEAAHEMHRSANQIQDAVYRMETVLNSFGNETLQCFIEEFKKQVDRLEAIHGNTKDNQ